MTFRIENKYRISPYKLFELYSWIKSNNGKKIYPDRTISSIYFDNNNYSSYSDSIEGVVPRKKIRIRFYEKELKNAKLVLFEKKINSVEGRYKNSTETKNFGKWLKYGIFDQDYGLCFSKTLVQYKREYFETFKVRLTLDTNIKYLSYQKLHLTPNRFETDSDIILEVKSSANLYNYINEKFYLEKIRFSKYCNSIDYLKLV